MAGILDLIFGGGQGGGGVLPPWLQGQQPQQQQQDQQAPPMAQPGMAPAAGGGNPFLAGLMSFGNSRTPLGGLANAVGAFSTGERTDPGAIAQNQNLRDYLFRQAEAQRQQGNTERQLKLAESPEFTTVGQNILQQPQYGFVNRLTQSITQPGSTSPSAAGGVAGMAGIDDNKPLYDQLPKAEQAIVDNMLSARKQPPSAMALKTPYWNTLIRAASEKAQEKGGTFDETIWGQRHNAAKDLAPQGKSGQTINALDTVQGHIEKLSNAVENLDNSTWPLVNMAGNALATHTGLSPERSQNLTSFNNARKAVVDEMARAYKGGHMSDAEIRDWSALIQSSDSPVKLRQALADFTELLNTKREALINQYKGLDVSFKGANDEQNARVTKLVHDRNAGVSALGGSIIGKPGETITGWTVKRLP